MSSEITEKSFGSFTWSDLYIPKEEDVSSAADRFSLGALQVLDAVQSGHLPKFEKDDRFTFIILRGLVPELPERTTDVAKLSNKIAIFYNDTQVITIHGGVFNFLKIHIDDSFTSSEQLVLAITRNVVSKFEAPAEVFSKKLIEIEETVFLSDTQKEISLEHIYFQKAQLRIAKKLLDMNNAVVCKIEVSKKLHTEYQDISEDLTHHLSTYNELFENWNNLVSTHLSINAQRNNDIVRVLTIFSAFFLPLTFIVGIYGMNFDFFPELRMHYGYTVVMFAMAAICLVIYIWFKKKKML